MRHSLAFDSFVLAASTDTLAVEPAAREHADAVEFRLDLAADPLSALSAYDGALPLIATNRAAWEGGTADSEADRLETLAAAVDHEAVAAVDIELRALEGREPAADAEGARAVRTAAREAGVPIIASVHDFESTPPAASLSALLERGSAAGDVAKCAVTAHDRADALAVLQATHEATTAGHRVATMAMGEAGRHTRAVAPLYGSRIGYAPVDSAAATAPGQYALAELSALVSQLDSRDATAGNDASR
jgi:3-dehydroquinate dehydratase-1